LNEVLNEVNNSEEGAYTDKLTIYFLETQDAGVNGAFQRLIVIVREPGEPGGLTIEKRSGDTGKPLGEVEFTLTV
jgi:hypothetical protein